MIGIILLLIIGGLFYKLAEKYGKNKLGFGLLGVVIYYGGTFIYGIVYGIIYFTINPYASEDDLDITFLQLTAILAGIIFSFVFYYLFERNWKKNKKAEKRVINIDDIGSGNASDD